MKLESGRMCIIKKEPGVEDTLSGAKRDDKAEQKSSKLNSTNLKTWHAFIGAHGASKIKIESSEFVKPSLTDFLKADFFPEAQADSTYVETSRKCPFCDGKFRSEKKLSRHLKYHTAVTSWKCEICQLAFRNKFHLTQHTRVHTGEKPFQC